jgi:hypothetical protein
VSDATTKRLPGWVVLALLAVMVGAVAVVILLGPRR